MLLRGADSLGNTIVGGGGFPESKKGTLEAVVCTDFGREMRPTNPDAASRVCPTHAIDLSLELVP